MTGAVLPSVRAPFRCLTQTIVPEAAALDAAGWAQVEGLIETALAERPPALRRQLRAFIRLLEWLPLLRWGRRFTTLDPSRRARLLARVQDSPLLLLRRGFWGLRTLVLLGYYARPAAAAEVGYHANHRGWGARR